MGFQVGMKVYDNDWYLKHNLSYEDAADLLSDWGVDFILTQSRALPMPDTAVKSEVPEELAARYASYDDRAFRDALAARGIGYWATVLMFFDPEALADDPSLASVDSCGRTVEAIDWYVGIPPTKKRHVAAKIAAISEAVQILEPDGVHLGFMRWPGFWELRVPGHDLSAFPEQSYDRESLEQFMYDAGVEVPDHTSPAKAAAWIKTNARKAWTDWKCAVVVDVISQVKEAGRRFHPELKIMLNTVPFKYSEFGGVQETHYGQRFEELASVVDVFEVMAYHQILKRPAAWIGEIGKEVKMRTKRTTVCTLQSKPLYLDGIHGKENRSETLDGVEFGHGVKAAKEAGIDGVVFFTWSDFLDQVLIKKDESRLDIIRRAKN
jgi:hypothetical protein